MRRLSGFTLAARPHSHGPEAEAGRKETIRGSVRRRGRQSVARGARDILGHLKPQNEVANMISSSHTESLQDFTTDRSLAASGIDKASAMKSEDGTFIHESMYEAVKEAMKSTTSDSRRVLVWFSCEINNHYFSSVC